MRCECRGHAPGFLGVTSLSSVKPMQRVEVITQPAYAFHVERFYVLAECLEFTLYDIRVGTKSQFASSVEVAAEPFGRPYGLGPEGRLLRHVREEIARAIEVRGDVDPRTDLAATPLPPGLDVEIETLGRPVKFFDRLDPSVQLRTIVMNRGNDPCVFRAVYFGQIGE